MSTCDGIVTVSRTVRSGDSGAREASSGAAPATRALRTLARANSPDRTQPVRLQAGYPGTRGMHVALPHVVRTKLDPSLIRIAVGIIAYLVVLGLVAVFAYSLWAGPQELGVTEHWPLAMYFVVPYVGTLLVASGIVAAIRAGPEIIRRMM
jgi:hypothetical protein